MPLALPLAAVPLPEPGQELRGHRGRKHLAGTTRLSSELMGKGQTAGHD